MQSMRLTFGKFKGRDIRNVPERYLSWIVTKAEGIDADTVDAVRQHLGLMREKYPSVERSLNPPTGRSRKQKASLLGSAEEFLRRPENRVDVEIAAIAPVQDMAAASERIRQRWEARTL